MLNQSSSSAFCAAVRVRLADGGEFLIWAAGRERPDEGLVELFSVAHEGMTYAGAVANGDKAAPIIVDEQGEARGRCALTLFENERYFWRWRGGDGNKPGSSLTDAAGKAEWSAYQEHDCWRGQFRVMNYLGFAWIEVAGVKIRFEVQTRKLDYETEYHRMVEAIAEECQQLLLEWDSPVSMHIAADPDRSSETLLERFLFLRHVLAPDRIDFFLELVRRRPHTLLVKERTWEPAACAGYVAVAGDPLALGRGWQSAGEGNGLAGTEWMPSEVRTERKFETLDTPPNRFLKFALGQFRATCEEVVVAAGRKDWRVAAAEARELLERIDSFLDDPFFDDVGPMSRLPLDSQVLQKREGYRDILLAWLMHDAAARLNWPGRDEVYDGTNRNVAELYEYWLFFRLRAILKSGPLNMRELPGEAGRADDAKPFISPGDNGLQISLKEGEESVCRFDWSSNGRRLRVHLFYNRRFTRAEKPGVRGSYTRTLRPDYTIVLLPVDLAEGMRWDKAEDKAEKEGRIAYLHFDAKYRLDRLQSFFGDKDEEDDPDRRVSSQSYKRADLYKMHTYADAIRRTTGAYVLYPGTDADQSGLYEEILPSVGAFPMRPHDENAEQHEGNRLAEFLLEALQHHVNEFSRDYRIRHWTRKTLRETKPAGGYGAEAPQAPPGDLPPSDTIVLRGFVREDDEALCRDTRKFFCHAVKGDGRPVNTDPAVLNAVILVPYRHGVWLDWWARIKKRELVHRDTLAARLRTKPGRHEALYYYLLELEDPVAFEALPVARPPVIAGAPSPCSWGAIFHRED